MQPVFILLKIELYSEYKVQSSFKFVTGWSARLAHNSLTKQSFPWWGWFGNFGEIFGLFLGGVLVVRFGGFGGGSLFLLLKQFADC